MSVFVSVYLRFYGFVLVFWIIFFACNFILTVKRHNPDVAFFERGDRKSS